jgi:hypothetical protein
VAKPEKYVQKLGHIISDVSVNSGLTTDYFQRTEVSPYVTGAFKFDRGLQLVHQNKNQQGVCKLRRASLPSVMKWDDARWVYVQKLNI